MRCQCFHHDYRTVHYINFSQRDNESDWSNSIGSSVWLILSQVLDFTRGTEAACEMKLLEDEGVGTISMCEGDIWDSIRANKTSRFAFTGCKFIGFS